MSVATIDAQSFGQRLKSGVKPVVIDVRSPGEYRTVHLDDAINIPLDEVSASRIQQAATSAQDGVFVVCQSGMRGARACEKLASEGVQAVNVEGGTNACIAAGLPVTRGKGMISIERQVRIGAGSLTLLGVVLGFAIHPAFFGLSAFIGSGLIFAGVTDWCGMGIALSKMPWNR